jgi:hypothetical protein
MLIQRELVQDQRVLIIRVIMIHHQAVNIIFGRAIRLKMIVQRVSLTGHYQLRRRVKIASKQIGL